MKYTLKARLEITRQAKQAIREVYAWPGGYPLALICNDGAALCPQCARENWRSITHDTLKGWRTGWDLARVGILWDGYNPCDQCGADLTAYPTED